MVAHDELGWFPSYLHNCKWQLSSQTPGDGAPKSMRIIPSAAGEVTIATGDGYDCNLVSSHKYYLSLQFKFESQASGTIDWYWPIAEPPAVEKFPISGDSNTWIRCSFVFTRPMFNDGKYQCRFDYNNESVNVAFRIASCMLFDLTEAFGVGNEPSKEWMDNHISTFSNTHTVQYYENLDQLFTDIANAISTKSGQTGEIFACDFADIIRNL